VLKFLFAPFRLATGWGVSPRILGWLGITMLVLLRLTIGWHFFSEGVDKVRAGNWTAEPFFANASGPLAPQFRKMVWDAEGDFRLDFEKVQLQFARFRDQVGKHYGFDQAQLAEAQDNYIKAMKQYSYVVELNSNEIEEFKLGGDRIAALEQDPTRSGVSSLKGQMETIRRERKALIAPLLNQIKGVWSNYELAQNRVADEEQRNAHPAISIMKPPSPGVLMDTSRIDVILPYFDVVIGLLLLVGLFTPLTGLIAAGFLGSVFLSQYPPATGPSSSIYPLIEGMGCLVLASTGSGRFAGLDFFLHLITRRTADPD